MSKKGLLWLVLTIQFSLRCCADDKFLIEIDKYRRQFIDVENKLWEHWQDYNSYRDVNEEVKQIMRRLADFDKNNLNQLPQSLLYGVEPLRPIRKFMDLQKELVLIDAAYKKFNRYRTNCLRRRNRDCEFNGLIDDVTNSETGINVTMLRIEDILYRRDDGVSEDLSRFTGVNTYPYKNIPQSAQQLYYNFYNLLALNQLKAYILLQVVNLIRFLSDKNNKVKAIKDSNITRHQYIKWVQTAFDKLKLNQRQRSRDIVRADPHGFVKGKNYDEFTRLLQGHIENEVDMNKQATCLGTCAEYVYAKNYRCYEGSSDYCQKIPKCNGNIIGCFFVESDATICISKTFYRRYEFVTYTNGKHLGPKTHCSERRTVNSWQRWFVKCHYCMCLCDETGPKSDRYISMMPAYSDIKHQMVVTGIRFRKHNRMLHPQIQQGKLLPYGRIDPATVRWVDMNNTKITDRGVMDGIDFITLKYESRTLAVDDVELDDNHIVTGVQFIKFKNIIQLQVRAHPFNWLKGSINTSLGRSKTKTSYRIKIDFKQPDVPTKTKFPSRINDSPYRSVEFTHTDFDKDAAQTTIPFIDLMDVVTNPPVPLSGVGVTYRGNPGFGGFIAPKIKTIDFARFMNSDMSEKSLISFELKNAN